MKILVIEDELAALSCLTKDLENKEGSIKVLAYLHSVKNTLQWLQNNPQPDLILMETQLSDGPTSVIFRSFALTCPIILITDDLRQLNESLEYNSIGYLMKPVNPEKLDSALRKYQLFRDHFAGTEMPGKTEREPGFQKKSRILLKQGSEYQTIKVEDIGYSYTEGRLIFVVNKDNCKMLAEKTNLSELEEDLDPNLFYRANRKYIINANFIKRFMPIDRNKLSVELTLPVAEEIIISQENAAEFKKWIKEETAEFRF